MAQAEPQAAQTEAVIAEEQLLGSNDEDARWRTLLPFTRSHGASGIVAGSLARSLADAGMPPATTLEALQALVGATGREPQDGDAFYVRWEQTYAAEGGQAIGVGRVLWLELRTPDATIALHRFRPRCCAEQFFVTTGEAAMPHPLVLPIEDLNISSRFGMRPDPLTARNAVGPLPPPRGKPTSAAAPFRGFAPRLFMHEGVDFAVPRGTPIYAAAEGVVAEARPKGGYGNFVRIEHDGGRATAYAHLSRFAPGLKAGARVGRGELVGFTGNTGRSTGPHLHFEVLADGKPVDPLAHAAVAQLGGAELEQFQKQVAAQTRERASEAAE